MTVLLLLIFASLALAGAFLGAFIWAVRAGQFEDTCTPSMRVLTEENQSRNRSELTEANEGNEAPAGSEHAFLIDVWDSSKGEPPQKGLFQAPTIN